MKEGRQSDLGPPVLDRVKQKVVVLCKNRLPLSDFILVVERLLC
jgi:hypothetical protein